MQHWTKGNGFNSYKNEHKMSAEEERAPTIVKEESDEPVDLERGDIEDYNKEVTEQNAEPGTASQETQCCTPYVLIFSLSLSF